MYNHIVDHAKFFADFLESRLAVVHTILRRYQSKEVVDDEVRRSTEALRHIQEIERYFHLAPLSLETASFLPLNLPLYSFVLFAVMPAYQSVKLTIRPPQRMQELFTKLFHELCFKDYYPNINLFSGSQNEFLSSCCRTASVVIFTGKYENSLSVRRICSRNALVLYSGVGHNPLVITSSADINLAVEKTLQVKMFNSGQDCAGPDIILVHRSVADTFLERLLEKLSRVKCDCSYEDDAVVGPLFETSSLLNVAKLLSEMSEQGAIIHYGGQLDLKHNIVYPCVVRASLRQMQNFRELYSPVLVVTEYESDQELSLYFDNANARYQLNEMYVSLFGESKYVEGKRGSIILKNCTVQDVERGTEEYGGYSPGASSVSHQGISIAKPIFIPREIHNFLSPRGQKMFASIPKVKGNWLRQVISTQFQEIVQQIFGNELVFAYIFGSCATEDGRRYSDIDTLVCVYSRKTEQIERYLEWLFFAHQMFGRIPDFKYPAEILPVTFEVVQAISHNCLYEKQRKNNEIRSFELGRAQTPSVPLQQRGSGNPATHGRGNEQKPQYDCT